MRLLKIAEIRDNGGIDQTGDNRRWEISGTTQKISKVAYELDMREKEIEVAAKMFGLSN